MAIPTELLSLIDRLNQELDQTKQQATEGLSLARAALSRFTDNAILIQLFASLNNVLLFVETYRRRIQATVELLSPADVTAEEIQEAGEDLATILGLVLEAKIVVSRASTRLENFQ